MKILFFTDTHLAADAPGQRMGDYGRDMLEKLQWVADLAQSHDVTYFGGDLVNAPGVSLRVVNAAAEIMQQMPNLGLVWGQHDLVGHSPTTICRSAASIAFWALAGEHPGTEPYRMARIGGLDTWLVSHHTGIDEEIVSTDPLQWSMASDVAVIHALVGYQIPVEAVTLASPVILTGDYHQGYQPTRVRDSWFFNPGALSRKTIDDYHRIPQVASIEYDQTRMAVGDWEYLLVPCRSARRRRASTSRCWARWPWRRRCPWKRY